MPPFRPRGPACLLAGCVQNHARPAVVSLVLGFLGGAGVSGCKDRTAGAPGTWRLSVFILTRTFAFLAVEQWGSRSPSPPCGLIPPGQACQLRAALQAPGHQLHVWVLQALAGSLCTGGATPTLLLPAHPDGAWVPPDAQYRPQGPRPRDARRYLYV